MIVRLTPLVLVACTQPSERQLALEATFEHVASGYSTFAQQTANLESTTQILCEGTSADSLAAAQEAWSAARGAYKRVSAVGFGPVEEQPDRLGPLIDFWPARDEAIETLLASDAGLSPDEVSQLGASTRGLPALEYVLFDANALTTWVDNPRRCTFVRSAATDLNQTANNLVEAWERWRPVLTTPEAAPYATEQDVLNEWVNRVIFAAEDVRLEKLDAALGDEPGDVRPDVLESRYAQRSVQDAVDTLDGAHAILLQVLPLAENPALTADAESAYEQAREALTQLREPLQDTMLVEPEIVQRAQDAVQRYQIVVQADVAQALSVTVVFNDNDGD